MLMNSNRIFRLLSIVALILAAVGCRAQSAEFTTSSSYGRVETVPQMPAFDIVRIETAVIVHITQGKNQRIRVKNNYGYRLKLEVLQNTLIIDLEESVSRRNSNNQKYGEVWVTVPSLKGMINNGVADVDIQKIKSKELRLQNDGVLTLDVNNVDIGTLKYLNDGVITENLSLDCEELYMLSKGVQKSKLTLAKNDIFNMNCVGVFEGGVNVTGKNITIDNSGTMKINMALFATSFTFNNNNACGRQNINFTGDDISIYNYNGTSTVDLQVDCKRLTASNSGVSRLVISGTADETEIKNVSEGVSRIDTSRLNQF